MEPLCCDYTCKYLSRRVLLSQGLRRAGGLSKVEENTGGNSPSHDSQSSAFLIRLDLNLHLCVSLSCWALQGAHPQLQAVETELRYSALPWQFLIGLHLGAHTLSFRGLLKLRSGQAVGLGQSHPSLVPL